MSGKKINGVEIKELRKEDALWYSMVREQLENLEFGSVEMKLVIRNNKVTGIKFTNEKTFNLHNLST